MIQSQRSYPIAAVAQQRLPSKRPPTPLMVVTSDEDELLEHKVEQICALGCRQVYQRIDELRAGVAVPELAGLNVDQIAAVLSELESIMAVYTENGATCLLERR